MLFKILALVLVPLGLPVIDQRLTGDIPGVEVKEREGRAPDVRLSVKIDAEGKMFIDGKEVKPKAIERSARRAMKRHEKVKLYIAADREAPAMSIKKVAKAAGEAGVNNVIFSALAKKKEP